MTIFAGLQNEQAVKISDNYVVQLTGRYNIDYVVGEKSLVGQVLLPSLDGIRRVKKQPRKLSHYVHTDETQVTLEQVTAFRQKWADYLDEDGDWCSGDVDKQVEYVREKATYINLLPVYEDQPDIIEDVTIGVVGEAIDTGSAFIETPYTVGELKHKGFGDGVFKVRLGAIAQNAVRETCKSLDVDYNIPTHGNIEYVKVNGNYLFTNNKEHWVKSGSAAVVVTTLEDAQQREKSIRDFINKRIQIEIDKTQLNEVNRKLVYDKLRSMRNKVIDIDAKSKSVSDKRAALKLINDLLQTIEDNFEHRA